MSVKLHLPSISAICFFFLCCLTKMSDKRDRKTKNTWKAFLSGAKCGSLVLLIIYIATFLKIHKQIKNIYLNKGREIPAEEMQKIHEEAGKVSLPWSIAAFAICFFS